MSVSAERPTVRRHLPLLQPALLLAALLVASVALLFVSIWLAAASFDPILRPREWLARLDPEAAQGVLAGVLQIITGVLAVAVTVVAIVVELAANRYSHQITRLFLREPVNLAVLGLLVLTSIQCVWAAMVMGGGDSAAVMPQAGFAITIVMFFLSVLLLIPYMYFVFAFLSPISVIDRICRDAYRVILRAQARDIPGTQLRVQEAVDQLQDVARSAIQQGDRGIALAAVEALANLFFDYSGVRGRLPAGWFECTPPVTTDPDFIALSPEATAEVSRQGLWLERKILRRYLALMEQAAGEARDVANLIGIKTQRIITELGPQRAELLELGLRAFNSYLRATISAHDARTAYYLMNLYRMAASQLLRAGREAQAVAVGGYLAEYGQAAHKAGSSFLLETVAHDLVLLIQDALDLGSTTVDTLVGYLLALDHEIKEESQEVSLLGVRRAQLQLATLFMMLGHQERADRVIADLRTERLERLERVRAALMTDEREQFWELVDRDVNFAYLPPARRAYLDAVFRALREAPQPCVPATP